MSDQSQRESQRAAVSIPRNVVTNLGSNAVIALSSFVFVPVYISVLGMEVFGLIGLFASIQAVLALLDLGLGSSATRELARISRDPAERGSARQFVRTLEIVYWTIGLGLGIVVSLLAPLIAKEWVTLSKLSIGDATHALALMGAALAARWPFALYVGALNGLERQPLLNGLRTAAEILRSAGAAVILVWISPTLQAFLVWQIAACLTASLAAALITWRVMPPSSTKPRFDWQQLRRVGRYMVGISAISLTVVVLTQVDKIVLSRLLSLEAFGYYALAWTIANALTMLTSPIFTAFFPSLARAARTDDTDELRSLYHRGSQVMAALLIPTGIMVAFFAHEVLVVWTQDPSLADKTHVVLSVLLVGTMINGLMNIPYALLLAHGWTSLPFYANLVAIAVFIPLVWVSTTLYGAIGAAFAWLLLNLCHMVITLQIIHGRILPEEKADWYINDIVKPALIAICLAAGAKLVLGEMTSLQFVVAGLGVFLALLCACAFSLRHVRADYFSFARRFSR